MPHEIDQLTDDEVQMLRSRLDIEQSQVREMGGAQAPGEKLLVALGDSWFDYPPGFDLIFCLKKFHQYQIENFAKAGDTLENMVYGTKFGGSDWRRDPCRLIQVTEAITKLKPKAVLFSAGGNDLAGSSLDSFYNHADSNLHPERTAYMDYVFNEVFFDAYCYFVEMVCEAYGQEPNTKESPIIVGHSYANAIPDGTGVTYARFTWFGPWLRPTFTRKGHVRLGANTKLIAELMKRFVAMLDKVSAKYSNFHYVNFRDDIGLDDWANELHLKNSAAQKCAAKLAAKLSSLGV